MAGVQLQVANVPSGIVTNLDPVPSDESWLVYFCRVSLTDGDNLGLTSYTALSLYSSNTATTVCLYSRQLVVAEDRSGFTVGPFVMNAGDYLIVDPDRAVDVYVSGLIQRGPGLVPG